MLNPTADKDARSLGAKALLGSERKVATSCQWRRRLVGHVSTGRCWFIGVSSQMMSFIMTLNILELKIAYNLCYITSKGFIPGRTHRIAKWKSEGSPI